MKLATWNCCGKFGANLRHLLAEDVDVAVLCEASPLPAWPTGPGGRTVTGMSRPVLAPSLKELAVVACAPWSVRMHEDVGSAPAWTLPVRVSGPTSFTLVGLWPVTGPDRPSYVGQIDRAVDWIEQACATEPVVLAGDFNAPISSTQAQYGAVTRRLDKLGLVDAYRVARGLDATEVPTEATYYQHRRQERPFHIDHLVVPTTWADGVTVEVGDFDTWIASGRSDHAPVIAELRSDLSG